MELLNRIVIDQIQRERRAEASAERLSRRSRAGHPAATPETSHLGPVRDRVPRSSPSAGEARREPCPDVAPGRAA